MRITTKSKILRIAIGQYFIEEHDISLKEKLTEASYEELGNVFLGLNNDIYHANNLPKFSENLLKEIKAKNIILPHKQVLLDTQLAAADQNLKAFSSQGTTSLIASNPELYLEETLNTQMAKHNIQIAIGEENVTEVMSYVLNTHLRKYCEDNAPQSIICKKPLITAQEVSRLYVFCYVIDSLSTPNNLTQKLADIHNSLKFHGQIIPEFAKKYHELWSLIKKEVYQLDQNNILNPAHFTMGYFKDLSHNPKAMIQKRLLEQYKAYCKKNGKPSSTSALAIKFTDQEGLSEALTEYLLEHFNISKPIITKKENALIVTVSCEKLELLQQIETKQEEVSSEVTVATYQPLNMTR